MDKLVEELGSAMSVSAEDGPSTAAPHPRFSSYKVKSKRDQAVRRMEMLCFQKLRREAMADFARQLAEADWTGLSEEEDDHEPKVASKQGELGSRSANTGKACNAGAGPSQEPSVPAEGACKVEEMDVTVPARVARRLRPHRHRRNQLMLSEWLEEIPHDFPHKWCMVICPEGKRCLVIVSKGKTKCYAKSGLPFATLTTCMQRHVAGGGYTILDCIHCERTSTLYVLDVMCWNNFSLYDCETEFRFFWLKSKLAEELNPKSRKPSEYAVVEAPRYPSDPASVTEGLRACSGAFQVDGLLFYHTETVYTFGPTPLVGWLKPYMVVEMGIVSQAVGDRLEEVALPAGAAKGRVGAVEEAGLPSWVTAMPRLGGAEADMRAGIKSFNAEREALRVKKMEDRAQTRVENSRRKKKQKHREHGEMEQDVEQPDPGDAAGMDVELVQTKRLGQGTKQAMET